MQTQSQSDPIVVFSNTHDKDDDNNNTATYILMISLSAFFIVLVISICFTSDLKKSKENGAKQAANITYQV